MFPDNKALRFYSCVSYKKKRVMPYSTHYIQAYNIVDGPLVDIVFQKSSNFPHSFFMRNFVVFASKTD